jgi:hypothetical protein
VAGFQAFANCLIFALVVWCLLLLLCSKIPSIWCNKCRSFAYCKAHPSWLPRASVLLNSSAVKQVWCIPILLSVQLSTGAYQSSIVVGYPLAGLCGQAVTVLPSAGVGVQSVS